MKDPYIIIYDNFDDPEHENLFVEAITSNFVSKKGRENMYIIINDKELNSVDIFELIKSKLDIESNFIVVKLDDFYGTFNYHALEWLKHKFPDSNWK